MITKTQKNALLKSLGKKHITKIRAYALENNVKKETGEEYSNSAFSAVLNGRLDHPEIEKLIFDTADHWFKQTTAEQARRNEFLKKVNAQ